MRRSGWQQRRHLRRSVKGKEFGAGRARSSLSRQLRKSDVGLHQRDVLREVAFPLEEERALYGLSQFPDRGRPRFFADDKGTVVDASDVLLEADEEETQRISNERASKIAMEQVESLKSEDVGTREAVEDFKQASSQTHSSLEDLLESDAELNAELKKTRSAKKQSEKLSAGAYKKTLIERAKADRFENMSKAAIRKLESDSVANQARLARIGIEKNFDTSKVALINAERQRELENIKANTANIGAQARLVSTEREARLLQRKLNAAREVLARRVAEEEAFNEAVRRKFLLPHGSFSLGKIKLGSPISLNLGNILRDDKVERDYARGFKSFEELGI